jgi:hypothetical protein
MPVIHLGLGGRGDQSLGDGILFGLCAFAAVVTIAIIAEVQPAAYNAYKGSS